VVVVVVWDGDQTFDLHNCLLAMMCCHSPT